MNAPASHSALVRHETQSLESRLYSLWLYLGDAAHQRGQVVAYLGDAPSCEDLRALERAVGRTFPRVCIVLNTFVAHDLVGQGYGIQLYADLAKTAAKLHGVPVVSSACCGNDISDEARRLWGSRRLANRVRVHGLTAWGGGA